MTPRWFGPTKGGKLHNNTLRNIIWSNQKVFLISIRILIFLISIRKLIFLITLAMFDVTCFPFYRSIKHHSKPFVHSDSIRYGLHESSIIKVWACFPQDTDNLDNEDLQEMLEMTEIPDLEFKDDGYIELVLRILGLMCDNQHEGLQVPA